jgi:hypothetical protein
MPHLMVARNVNPNAGAAFFVGNVAPDTVRDRQAKERVHFDDISDGAEREKALRGFARKADTEYLRGFLLHLYVDWTWKWKSTVLSDFINKTGSGWFPKYREEIGKITANTYHNTDWARGLYELMDGWDYNGFAETEDIKAEDTRAWVKRSWKWQEENRLEASEAFPPKMLREFTERTAEDFEKWYIKGD